MPDAPPETATLNGRPSSTALTNTVGQNLDDPAPAARTDVETGDGAATQPAAATDLAGDEPSVATAGQVGPGERVTVDAAWVAWARQQLLQPVECEATHHEVGVSDDTAVNADTVDPFDADLLLAGPDPTGREIAVWLRLTPTVITDLQNRLDQVLTAQRNALGFEPSITSKSDTLTHDPADDDDSSSRAAGRVRRIADPLGVRSMLQTSSTRAQVIIAAAIVALVLVAVIVRMTS